MRSSCVNEDFAAGGNYRNIFGASFFEYKLNHLRSRLCKMVYVIGRISYILNEVTIVIRSSLLWLERS